MTDQAKAFTAITLFLLGNLCFFWPLDSPFTFPKLLFLSLAGMVFAGRQEQRLGLDLLGLALLLWPIGALVRHPNHWETLRALTIALPALAAVALRPLLDEKTRQVLASILSWCGVATSLYLIAQHLRLDPFPAQAEDAPGSFFGNPNFAAHALLAYYCLSETKRKNPLAERVLMAAGILISGSRGTILMLGIWLVYKAKPGLRKPMIAAFALAVLFLSAYFHKDLAEGAHWLRNPQVWAVAYEQQPRLVAERESWFHGKRASLMMRPILWGNSLHLVLEAPLTGVGAGRFHVSYPEVNNRFANDVYLNDDYRVAAVHNLPLALLIAFGVPWCLGAMIWLWRRRQWFRGDWGVAVGLQFAIALVSLNYLNPVIVIVLILMRPPDPQTPSQPWSCPWSMPLCCLIIAALTFWDWRAAHPDPKSWLDQHLFPARCASIFYEQGESLEALRSQLKVVARDPHGPETLYNLALIAGLEELNHLDGTDDLARTALGFVCERYPFYRPAKEHWEQDFGANGEPTLVNETELRRSIQKVERQLQP